MLFAALDQSGGSTPATLKRYGAPFAEGNMMSTVHLMRERIVSSPAFKKAGFDGVILFKDTIQRGLYTEGVPVFAKVDTGMTPEGLLKPLDLMWLMEYKGRIKGTKMRSVVQSPDMVYDVIEQQYEYAVRIRELGFTPIVEPEVDINHPERNTIEKLMEEEFMNMDLDGMILKLTIPWDHLRYRDIKAPIVALSGGYTRKEAVEKLQHIPHMGASFSRALLEGLEYNMTDKEFDKQLAKNIKEIKGAL